MENNELRSYESQRKSLRNVIIGGALTGLALTVYGLTNSQEAVAGFGEGMLGMDAVMSGLYLKCMR